MSLIKLPDEFSKKPPENIIRVLISIPNEGTTAVESYTNRLSNFMHLGNLQTEFRVFNDYTQVLAKHDPDLAHKVALEYAQTKAKYIRVIDGKTFEFLFLTLGRLLTPYAREKAAELALKSYCDYLFMIDDDMICPDDLFERLYRHNVDIVAPLAFTRNYPHQPVLYSIRDYDDPVTKAKGFIREWVTRYPKDKLVECDAVGFGAVLIKAKVLEKIPQPRFMTTTGAGEDVHFCYEAKKLGFRIFMDTSVKLGHLSHPIEVNEDYVETIRKVTNMEVEKKHPEFKKYEVQEIKPDEPVLILG